MCMQIRSLERSGEERKVCRIKVHRNTRQRGETSGGFMKGVNKHLQVQVQVGYEVTGAQRLQRKPRCTTCGKRQINGAKKLTHLQHCYKWWETTIQYYSCEFRNKFSMLVKIAVPCANFSFGQRRADGSLLQTRRACAHKIPGLNGNPKELPSGGKK